MTILVKKRKSRPKSGHSKICISVSQERWALGFCMEVAQSLKSH